MRRIKVIGYPFSTSGVAHGCAQTPKQLASLPWFQNLQNLEYEEVQIEGIEDQKDVAENERLTFHNSMKVRQHTYQALKDGYFPIILGGDNSLSLGTILAMKK